LHEGGVAAIPELLDTLDIKGTIVAIDAMRCQLDIVAKIVACCADYVLGVKAKIIVAHQERHN